MIDNLNFIAITVKAAAPEEIPNVYGVARLFLKIFWKIKPAKANADPTINAIKVRGTRSCQKIKFSSPASDDITFAGLIFTTPIKGSRTTNTNPITIMIIYFFLIMHPGK